MRKIVTNITPEVSIDSLTGRELIAYKCKNVEAGRYSVAVLTKLVPGKYGFVALDYSAGSTNPRFEGNSFFQCIKLAGEKRQLYTFDDLSDLAKAIYEKKIQ